MPPLAATPLAGVGPVRDRCRRQRPRRRRRGAWGGHAQSGAGEEQKLVVVGKGKLARPPVVAVRSPLLERRVLAAVDGEIHVEPVIGVVVQVDPADCSWAVREGSHLVCVARDVKDATTMMDSPKQ